MFGSSKFNKQPYGVVSNFLKRAFYDGRMNQGMNMQNSNKISGAALHKKLSKK